MVSDVLSVFVSGKAFYMIPMYLRPIQVPKGALIRTQRIIIIFFLKTGIG